jgi:oligoendopeptidase F
MSKLRNEVALSDKWDLSPLYKKDENWIEDFEKNQQDEFSKKIGAYKNTLAHNVANLIQALDLYFHKIQSLEKLYTFAHLKHDEDVSDSKYKSLLEKSEIALQNFSEVTSWIEPEIFLIPPQILDSYLINPSFEKYKFHLQKLIALKEHILSPQEEELLALASRAMQTPQKAFSSLNNADFVFDDIKDSQKQNLPLTHGLYQIYLQSRDRILRENAFKTLHKKFFDYKNTLSDLVHGQVLTHLFEAKSRKYHSCLEAALKPKNINNDVYTSLISAVKNNLTPLHNYFRLRKKLLNLKDIHLYDLNTPLTENLDIHFTYKEAEEMVIESVKPLGNVYQNILTKGLKNHAWVDRYENKNKRSGAYSSGCYDSYPYILMNFKGVIRDLSTLAHECGHSMHSYLSRQNQPFHYSQYPIFVAEVASTFNEELLFDILLKNAPSKEAKIYFITSRIDDLRSTLFRQTLFAEFELIIHNLAEQNIPLTPEILSEQYRQLNNIYYGSEVVIDDEINIEWARIPHFYYNFYVYQYATGISAAIALAKKVMQGSDKERENYLNFLKMGFSNYPIDLLKNAGVDMTKPTAVEEAIKQFAFLTSELEKISS